MERIITYIKLRRKEVTKMNIGEMVIFVDATTKQHKALVTAVHGVNPAQRPSLNLVYVSDDENAQDQYGRQLAERVTSIVHVRDQNAEGMYWYYD